jgi:hypothetical protein
VWIRANTAFTILRGGPPVRRLPAHASPEPTRGARRKA